MGIVVKDGYAYHQDTHLTVTNDSVSFSDGTSAYRLCRSGRDLLLLDNDGNSLLTLRPKWPSLHGRWEGYIGGSKRIFSVRRSTVIGRSGFTANVYNNTLCENFEIEGSFEQRRFTVYDAGRSRSVVAEINIIRKGVVDLCVMEGFDTAFSAALVVLIAVADSRVGLSTLAQAHPNHGKINGGI